MKKNILTLIIVLSSFYGFSQKIKVDKGEIKLDDKTVAYIEGKKPAFKILNLDKTYAVNLELKFLADGGAGKRWMIIKSEKTGTANEVDYKKFNPLNQEKSAIEAFIDKNFLTAEGLNNDAIESYINGGATGVSAKLKSEVNDAAKQKSNEESFQLTIDDSGTIYSAKAHNQENPDDKRIGFIHMKSPSANGELLYEVTDLDGYLIATWFAKSGAYPGYKGFLNQELITADYKVFKADFDNRGNPLRYKMSSDITAFNIVKTLVLNGYPLEHQGVAIQNEINAANIKIKEEQKKKDKENIEAAKLKSVNIYNKRGYVIDEKGEKTEGDLKIEFEDITADSRNSNIPFLPGKKLYCASAKDPFHIYQSKNGIRFCIEENGDKDCFIGLTCTGGSSVSSAIKLLNADNSFFYKILYENNGYMILVYPTAGNDFYIKTPNQAKGLYINQANTNKLKKNAAEYLKCDSLVFEKYDFTILNGLIKVLEDYKAACDK